MTISIEFGNCTSGVEFRLRTVLIVVVLSIIWYIIFQLRKTERKKKEQYVSEVQEMHLHVPTVDELVDNHLQHYVK